MGDTETDSSQAVAVKCCGFTCWRKSDPQQDISTSQRHYSQCPAKPVFIGDLPQPLLPGHCIEVTGVPLEQSTRFSVNFVCGQEPESDILLHFNPRLIQNYVVRNSKHNGKWGDEETTAHYRLNLPRKVKFHISFFIAPKEFLIAINDQHFCVFPFRIPIVRAKFVEVYGDIIINDVEVKEMTSYPKYDDNNYKSIPFDDVYNGETALQNPFIGRLEKGFKHGWQLEIHGKVKLLPHGFYMNLQEGNSLWPHPIIPLHLNPRFNSIVRAYTLICNSWENGKWGSEERSPGFHFVPAKPFRLVIQLDMDREVFIVWVDGQLECEFRIRNTYSARHIDTVYIRGDLVIYKVFMRERFTDVLEKAKK